MSHFSAIYTRGSDHTSPFLPPYLRKLGSGSMALSTLLHLLKSYAHPALQLWARNGLPQITSWLPQTLAESSVQTPLSPRRFSWLIYLKWQTVWLGLSRPAPCFPADMGLHVYRTGAEELWLLIFSVLNAHASHTVDAPSEQINELMRKSPLLHAQIMW